MTGFHAEIVCGEWETGLWTDSEEDYNIILPIENIIRHPNYSISRGQMASQYVEADLALFMVNDDGLKETNEEIYPACLPKHDSQLSNAVHSGWSSPPPLKFLQTSLPAYEPYYRDFHKQWHYKMQGIKCQDPLKDIFFNQTYKYPTNSYYPPATICALEKFQSFCPTSGESGSPLMDTSGDGRFSVIGTMSFIKGCSQFSYNTLTGYQYSNLTQRSVNPLVYTKLSCYLPWIAEQYNMVYEGDIDPDCTTGTGDINEVTTEACRSSPVYSLVNNLLYSEDRVEATCIFPFTYDDMEMTSCLMGGIDNFTHPIFRCPVRSLRDRGASYLSKNDNGESEIFNGYCPTNSIGSSADGSNRVYEFSDSGPVFGPNGEYEVDPDNRDCGVGLPLFGICKNNCPGGDYCYIL